MFGFQGTDCNRLADWRLSNTHSLLKTVPQLHYTAPVLFCTALYWITPHSPPSPPTLSLGWTNCGCGVARRRGQVPATQPTRLPSYYSPVQSQSQSRPSPSFNPNPHPSPNPSPSPSPSPNPSPPLLFVVHRCSVPLQSL